MNDTEDPRERAHDAVRTRLRALGTWMPATTAERDTALWSAVHDALDAAGVPRSAAAGQDSGPSVKECADVDRVWDLQKHGE